MFGRRRPGRGRHARAPNGRVDSAAATPGTASRDDPTLRAEAALPAGRPSGPWDESEPAPQLARIDLGAVRVPVLEGVGVALSLQEQEVVAARVTNGANTLQLQVFAAPKSGSLWAEVRREIVARLRDSGHEVVEAEGPFGGELRGELPVQSEQGPVQQAARFVGVDGPRWLLRGVFIAPPGSDPGQDRTLADVFRGTVVVRGEAPVPPRERLPLRAPAEARPETQQEARQVPVPDRTR